MVMKYRVFLLSLLLTACASQTNAPVEPVDSNHNQPVPAPVKAAPSKVSLLLPLQGDFITAGQAIRDGYLQASYQAKAEAQLTVINSQSGATIVNLYQQTLTDHQPDLVVGPLTKADVNALAAQPLLAAPVLALNRVDTAAALPADFYQFSLDPQAEARLVAQKMHADGYQKVIVIAPEGNWGQSIAASFGKAWLALNGQIINSAAYQKAQDFTAQAQTLLEDHGSDASPQTAIFLVANAQDARVLVPMLRHQPTPWLIYGMPMIYSGMPNAALNAALNGVIFPSSLWQLDSLSPARQNYANLYPDASEDALRLYGFGMDAFALSQWYLQQHSFSGVNLVGYSGQLTLVDGVIERQLVWAHFDAGAAVKG